MNTCCKTLRHGDAWHARWIPCGKPAKVERDGKHYCGIHNPAREEARKAARMARWKLETDAREATLQEEREINRKAACFDDLVAALSGMVNAMKDIRGIDPEEYKPQAFSCAREALTKAGVE